MFREDMGLKIFKDGEDFIYLYHPDTNAAVLEKWGGDLLIQCNNKGFFLIFTLGLEHEKYLKRVEMVLERRGVAFTINNS